MRRAYLCAATLARTYAPGRTGMSAVMSRKNRNPIAYPAAAPQSAPLQCLEIETPLLSYELYP